MPVISLYCVGKPDAAMSCPSGLEGAGRKRTPAKVQRAALPPYASQMLAAGMPVSSLQRYLGHEHLDTTMLYAEVSDPLLRQDYYQGIATLDPGSENLTLSGLAPTQQHTLRQLVEELKTPGLEQSRHNEILDIILANIK